MRLKSTHYDEQFKEEFLVKKPSLNQSKDNWNEFGISGEAEGMGEPVEITGVLAPSESTLANYKKNSLMDSK